MRGNWATSPVSTLERSRPRGGRLRVKRTGHWLPKDGKRLSGHKEVPITRLRKRFGMLVAKQASGPASAKAYIPTRCAIVSPPKPPFGGPEHVLKYLGRYTHRVAISNHRLVSLAEGRVTFRWRDSPSP